MANWVREPVVSSPLASRPPPTYSTAPRDRLVATLMKPMNAPEEKLALLDSCRLSSDILSKLAFSISSCPFNLTVEMP